MFTPAYARCFSSRRELFLAEDEENVLNLKLDLLPIILNSLILERREKGKYYYLGRDNHPTLPEKVLLLIIERRRHMRVTQISSNNNKIPL